MVWILLRLPIKEIIQSCQRRFFTLLWIYQFKIIKVICNSISLTRRVSHTTVKKTFLIPSFLKQNCISTSLLKELIPLAMLKLCKDGGLFCQRYIRVHVSIVKSNFDLVPSHWEPFLVNEQTNATPINNFTRKFILLH